jgi:hypothetical protein
MKPAWSKCDGHRHTHAPVSFRIHAKRIPDLNRCLYPHRTFVVLFDDEGGALNPAQAQASGLWVGWLHYGIPTALSLTIGATLSAAGLTLAIGLLISAGGLRSCW